MLSNPTESNARMIANQTKLDKEHSAVRELAKTRALLFFYDANDPKATSIAPALVQFAKDYHFVFKGVPITNETISGIAQNYSDIPHNRSVAKQMNIGVFPALVLLNPKTGKYQPIFYGYASINEIQKMMYIIQTNFNYKDFFND